MGFWSSLASIGTSLIPGIGPLIAPIVGGAVGALTGNGLGGNNGTNAAAQANANPGSVSPNIASGADNISQGANFDRAVLGGSTSATQQILGPEVSTVLGQYDNAAKTAANLGPRGGGATATLAEAPFAKAAAYGKILAGAKAGAAKDLTQEGTALTGAGQATDQFALGKAGVGVDQNKLQFGANTQNNAAYGQIGTSLGKMLANLKLGGSGGSGGSFGSTSPSDVGEG